MTSQRVLLLQKALSSLQSKLRYNYVANQIKSQALRGEVWATVINPSGERAWGLCECIGGLTRWARSLADPRSHRLKTAACSVQKTFSRWATARIPQSTHTIAINPLNTQPGWEGKNELNSATRVDDALQNIKQHIVQTKPLIVIIWINYIFMFRSINTTWTLTQALIAKYSVF